MVAAGARAELPPPGDCAGVYWDLTAAFEAGDRIYARVLLSRIGPGELSAAGQGHWIAPDGAATDFQNGRRAGRFEMDPTGRRLHIGSTTLDLTAATHRLGVDNDKRGVKLRVSVAAADAVSLPIQSGDLAVEVLHLASAAEARVWRDGMETPRVLRGHATWIRTTHARCERDLAALRVDVHRLAARQGALLVHEGLADGAQRSWLGWRDAEGALQTRRPERIALESWSEDPNGETLPRLLRPVDATLGGGIAIETSHLALDPLDALPRLVRMLYWFGANPRRAWTRATFDLTSEASPPPRGPALASFTLLRDLPPNLPPETGR
jgi:hypothetical protein